MSVILWGARRRGGCGEVACCPDREFIASTRARRRSTRGAEHVRTLTPANEAPATRRQFARLVKQSANTRAPNHPQLASNLYGTALDDCRSAIPGTRPMM